MHCPCSCTVIFLFPFGVGALYYHGKDESLHICYTDYWIFKVLTLELEKLRLLIQWYRYLKLCRLRIVELPICKRYCFGFACSNHEQTTVNKLTQMQLLLLYLHQGCKFYRWCFVFLIVIKCFGFWSLLFMCVY